MRITSYKKLYGDSQSQRVSPNISRNQSPSNSMVFEKEGGVLFTPNKFSKPLKFNNKSDLQGDKLSSINRKKENFKEFLQNIQKDFIPGNKVRTMNQSLPQSSKKSVIHDSIKLQMFNNKLKQSVTFFNTKNFQIKTHDKDNLTSSKSTTNVNLNKNRFELLYIIGRGGFGKVWKVIDKKTKKSFAMKEMAKTKFKIFFNLRVLTKKSVESVMNEKRLLSTLKHKFLINMIYSFQDIDNLYLVMDLVSGGDLRFHYSQVRKFKESQASKLIILFQNLLWPVFCWHWSICMGIILFIEI